MALKPKIQALIDYANETTEAGDVTLGECVKTLADGYGGGSDLVFYEKLIGDGVAYVFVDDPIISSDVDVTPQEKHDLIFEACPAKYNGYPFGLQYYVGGSLWNSYRVGFYWRTNTTTCGPLVNGNAYGNALSYVYGHKYRTTYHCDEASTGGSVICEDLDTGATRSYGNVKIYPNGIFGVFVVVNYELNTNTGTPLASTYDGAGSIFWGMKMVRRSDGAVVKDIRPCTYKGEVGLYDVVNEKFFGNAAGGGTLTVEGEIGSARASSPRVTSTFPTLEGEMSAKLTSLLAYSNEVTGAGDTRLGDAIRTLCEGWHKSGVLSDAAKAYAQQYGVLDTLQDICARTEGLADIVNEWPQVIHSLNVGTGFYNSLQVAMINNGDAFALHTVSNQNFNLELKFRAISIPNTWVNVVQVSGESASDRSVFLAQFGRNRSSLYLYTAQRSYLLMQLAPLWYVMAYTWGSGFSFNGDFWKKTETPAAVREPLRLASGQPGTFEYAYCKFTNNEANYHYVPFERDGLFGMIELTTGDFFPVPYLGQIDLIANP